MMGITMNMKRNSMAAGLVALMMTLAACQSESPTAPSAGNPPPTGGTPTPSVTITLAVSNSSPVISTASTDPAQTNATITATVTQAGGGVPNGTAVEFSTTLGTFTDTGTAGTVKTTTNGVASATLISTVAGTATVTVRVNDARQTTTVTFRDPSANQLGITGISPTTGSARGGTTVTITGRNFQGPLRVLFGTQEATIVSFNSTSITVLTPALSGPTTFGSTNVVVTVISLAGTPNEQRTSSAVLFTYTPEIVTPVLASVAPSSGPNEGNTRIVILGDGFQTPLRVYFGTDSGPGPLADQTELEVLQVTTNQIIALTPPALGLGAPLRNLQVTMRVHNIASNTEAILARAFRYGPLAVITSIAPGSGGAFGGTSLTIDGSGFDDPVAVTVAGIGARVIRVSGTQILVITNPTAVACTTTSGPVIVTNIEDGSQATGPVFTYAAVFPVITNVSPTSGPPGSAVSVTVANPGVGIDGTALIKFTFGTNTVFPSPSVITDPRGPIGFSVTVPSNVTFPSAACTVGGVAGTQMGPLVVNVTFLNATTTCTDTSTGAFTITPPAPNTCVATAPVAPPPQIAVSPATFCPNVFGSAAVAAGTQVRMIRVDNTAPAGAGSLIYSAASDSAEFIVTAGSGTVTPGNFAQITVTFDPNTLGARTGNITIQSNDPDVADRTITVCVGGTGT